MTTVIAEDEKEDLVVSEIRLSLLEKDLDGKNPERHTKHISAVITDPALCAAIQALIAPALVCPCRDKKTGKYNEKCKLCEGSGVPTLDTLPDAYKAEILPKDETHPAYLGHPELYPYRDHPYLSVNDAPLQSRPLRPDARPDIAVVADSERFGATLDPAHVRPSARQVHEDKQHGATFPEGDEKP
jgi:hypothetical protein